MLTERFTQSLLSHSLPPFLHPPFEPFHAKVIYISNASEVLHCIMFYICLSVKDSFFVHVKTFIEVAI